MANWLIETTAGTKGAFPANASIAAANPTIVTPKSQTALPGQSIVASFTGKVVVVVPALTQNALTTLKFSIPLATFPSSFSVAPKTTALVQATLSLSSAPSDPTTQVHTTSLSLSLVSGNVNTMGGGSGQWTVPAGTYQGPAINVTVGVTTTAANVATQKLTFLCNATMNQTAAVVAPTPTVTPGVTSTTSGAPTPTQTPQVGVVTLSGGTVLWTYPLAYSSTPVVVATAIGVPGNSSAEIYLSNPTNTHVTVNSQYNADNRAVNVLAFGNPS